MLDLSGVLYEGDERVPGAVDAVALARQSGLSLRFVTNTSQKPRATLLADLRAFGFDVADDELFTAVDAARQWLAERGLRPYCLVHDAIRDEFAELAGDDPNAVLVADAVDGFTYEALNEAFRLCLEGAPLLTVGYNRYYKSGGRLWLDAGAFARALEFAADVEAVVVGKPGADFFGQVLASVPAGPASAMMVGDDVFGDVEGALGAGLQACLVRTGKYRPGDEERITGDFRLVDSVVEAVPLALSG
jgi:HAD superfamily hydrolase (TIGR01458 family)